MCVALVTTTTAACRGPEATQDGGAHDVDTADAPLGEDAGACSASSVASVQGRVVDDRGVPVVAARPQLCARLEDERLVCLEPPFTDGVGRFVIEVPSEVRCMRSAVMRVLVTGGPHGTAYCPVAIEDVVDGRLVLGDAIELFEVRRDALPAYGDPTIVRGVSLGDVLFVELAPEAVGDEDDYARLGAVRVAPSRSCVPAARALAGLLVAAPEAAIEAPFRIPRSDLASGTRVTLHVVGGLDTRARDGSIVAEGELAPIGEGVVGVDGTITPEPSVLLPQLGWLGWSVAP